MTKNKQLNENIYSKKGQLFMNAIGFLTIFIPGIIILSFIILIKKDFLLGFLLAFLSLVIIFFGGAAIYGFNNKFYKLESKFRKDANYESYKKEIEIMINNGNLHPNTVFDLKLSLISPLYLINKKEANNLFDQLEEPQKQNVRYNLLKIDYYLNNQMYKEFFKTINQLKIKNSINKKVYAKIEDLIYIYTTYIRSTNIISTHKIDTKMQYLNLLNANTLMLYFYKRNEYTKANEYADFLIKNANIYLELKKNAENVLNKTLVLPSIVYFTKEIKPEKLLHLYHQLNITLPGNVAIKIHSGEPGNQNFLKPDFWKDIINYVNGTVVEANTAYEGKRNTTEKHLQTLKEHGWSEYFNVDLIDAEGPDLKINIENGEVIKENYVGKNIKNYNSMLVLSHFKGHPMGGYGGAIKQLSIGVASSYGKAYIHGAGEVEKIWTADHDLFLKSMADAALSVVKYFNYNLVYINVMKNMSVDCDCCAVAEDPCMKDIGILISNDPIAIDKACLDLVYNSDDPGKKHLIERIESRNGSLTIKAAEKLGYGTTNYILIDIDEL